MSIRHAALGIGAALVLGLGVYLFVEVRAQPAPVEGSGSGSAPSRTGAEPPPAAERPVPRLAGSAAGSSAAPASPGPALAPGDPAPTQDDLDVAMSEANRAYDRGDLDVAKTLASRLLAREPTNVRMLRIMVSASCIDGDTATAQASFTRLPPLDQAQMRVRCARYGMALPGP